MITQPKTGPKKKWHPTLLTRKPSRFAGVSHFLANCRSRIETRASESKRFGFPILSCFSGKSPAFWIGAIGRANAHDPHPRLNQTLARPENFKTRGVNFTPRAAAYVLDVRDLMVRRLQRHRYGMSHTYRRSFESPCGPGSPTMLAPYPYFRTEIQRCAIRAARLDTILSYRRE